MLWAEDASGDVLLEILLEGLLETHSWKDALHAKGAAVLKGLRPVGNPCWSENTLEWLVACERPVLQ